MKKLILILRQIIYERNMLSLIGNMSFSFLGFISFILLTRSLTQENFGLYVLFLSTGTFIDLFRFGLTRNAIVRYIAGASDKDHVEILGANTLISVLLVLFINLLIIAAIVIFPKATLESDFKYFFIYYPILAVSNLFWNNALSILQSWQAFGRILVLRLLNIGSFVVFLVLNVFWWHLGVVAIIWASIGSNVLSSLLSLAKGWDGTQFLFKSTKEKTLLIFNYGKYSVGTILGSSLLKSADTFLLGLAPFFGAVGVAQYAIPLKITEMLEIPLRSFMATAFPKMSKASIQNQMEQWKESFYSYGGAITLLFIPFTVLLFIFAEPIVFLLGGDQYSESLESLTLLFRVFTLYGLLLPLDRISGVALDSINKPHKNLWKVIFMASANIVGDLVAIYIFHSMFWVAMATVINTIVGLFMGYYYLGKNLKIEYSKFISYGFLFYKELIYKGIDKIKQ